MILCETDIFSIDESWLPQQLLPAPEPKHPIELPRRLIAQEKNMIEAALKESGGRVFGPTGAADKLGIPRSTLESKIRSLKSTRIVSGQHREVEGSRLPEITVKWGKQISDRQVELLQERGISRVLAQALQ